MRWVLASVATALVLAGCVREQPRAEQLMSADGHAVCERAAEVFGSAGWPEDRETRRALRRVRNLALDSVDESEDDRDLHAALARLYTAVEDARDVGDAVEAGGDVTRLCEKWGSLVWP